MILGTMFHLLCQGRQSLLDYANENFSLFFQDDWKAHPRLTLNLDYV